MTTPWFPNGDGSWSASVNGHSLHVWLSGSLWVATFNGIVVGRKATAREAKAVASQRANGKQGYGAFELKASG